VAYRFRCHYKYAIKHILKFDVKLYDIKNNYVLTLCCTRLKKPTIMSMIVDVKKLACYLRVKRVGSRWLYIE